ncbi:MAG TPA: hypothetical protein VF507_05715, partial [Pyrinomonadaceae bacterium]
RQKARQRREAERAGSPAKAEMVTLLISSFFLLALLVFALYRRQRAAPDEAQDRSLPAPPRFDGLFGEETAARARALAEADAEAQAASLRASLLARATEGDKESLLEAHAAGDRELYDEVLNALVGRARSSDKSLLALTSYLTRHETLRVNARLAEAVIESWQRAPDRSSTAKMLHLVALADDAGLYRNAVELAVRSLREGLIPDLTAEELGAIVHGEFWLLSQAARNSGAGFVLKIRLAQVRRELAANTTRTS